MLIAIMLIRVLCKKNLIPPSESLLSKTIYHLAGMIFVDDSELNIMNKGEESIEQVVSRRQEILTTWQQSLNFLVDN